MSADDDLVDDVDTMPSVVEEKEGSTVVTEPLLDETASSYDASRAEGASDELTRSDDDVSCRRSEDMALKDARVEDFGTLKEDKSVEGSEFSMDKDDSVSTKEDETLVNEGILEGSTTKVLTKDDSDDPISSGRVEEEISY